MRLFHVSEDSSIRAFSPRPAPTPEAGLSGAAVWSITELKLPNYLLPRDCPRVCYVDNSKQHTIVLENAWRRKIEDTVLYLYQFDSNDFEIFDDNAGYWISRSTVRPIIIRKITEPLLELQKRNIKLEFVKDLHPIKDRVTSKYTEFSIIRFRNAKNHSLKES